MRGRFVEERYAKDVLQQMDVEWRLLHRGRFIEDEQLYYRKTSSNSCREQADKQCLHTCRFNVVFGLAVHARIHFAVHVAFCFAVA